MEKVGWALRRATGLCGPPNHSHKGSSLTGIFDTKSNQIVPALPTEAPPQQQKPCSWDLVTGACRLPRQVDSNAQLSWLYKHTGSQ